MRLDGSLLWLARVNFIIVNFIIGVNFIIDGLSGFTRSRVSNYKHTHTHLHTHTHTRAHTHTIYNTPPEISFDP